MHTGTCGFPVAKRTYFKHFRVVEIQKSFYTSIKESLAIKWRKEAPEGFEFVLKAPQTVTHPPSSPTYRRFKGKMRNYGYFKVNEDVMSTWEQFRSIANILGAKIVIFQSPPSFSESRENVRNIIDFFSTIERDRIYGWEPRGKWDRKTIKMICEKANLVHVVDPFRDESVHGEFKYYRLHGKKGYRYDYSTSELLQLIKMVKNEDYVMFNNTHMWDNALKFQQLLAEVPPHKNEEQQPL